MMKACGFAPVLLTGVVIPTTFVVETMQNTPVTEVGEVNVKFPKPVVPLIPLYVPETACPEEFPAVELVSCVPDTTLVPSSVYSPLKFGT